MKNIVIGVFVGLLVVNYIVPPAFAAETDLSRDRARVMKTCNVSKGFQFTKDLSLGSKGSDIKRLNCVMVVVFSVSTSKTYSSTYSKQTESRVKKIQKELGVPITGKMDVATRAPINQFISLAMELEGIGAGLSQKIQELQNKHPELAHSFTKKCNTGYYGSEPALEIDKDIKKQLTHKKWKPGDVVTVSWVGCNTNSNSRFSYGMGYFDSKSLTSTDFPEVALPANAKSAKITLPKDAIGVASIFINLNGGLAESLVLRVIK